MTNIIITSNKLNRNNLIEYLKNNNIDSRPVFSPISEYPIWGKKLKAKKISSIVGNNALNLPSGVKLTKAEVFYISSKINDFFNRSLYEN